MSKKILIVTEYFYPEEFKINEVAQEWKNKGYEVDILTQNPTYPFGKVFGGYKNRFFSKEIYNGMTIYKVKAITGYKTSLFKKLLKYFSFMVLGSIVSLRIGQRYDYVFGFDVGALTGMVPAIILKQFYQKPVTLWVQDVWPDSVYAYGFKKTKLLEFFLNRFVKYIYRYSSNFAISTNGFEQKILPYLEATKEIIYAPNWADYLNKNLNNFSFSEDDKIHFTFAGNVGMVQNLENIITAFGKLNDEYLDKVQLNIIGDGSNLENLQNIVKNNNYKNIIFWGRIPKYNIYQYLNASDFLIISLIDKEIFSLTLPAKMQTYIAAGKPIIAIIKGEVATMVQKYNLGLIASPSDIKEIKSVLQEAINQNKEQKISYIKNSGFLTETVFNKKIIIDNLLRLLERG
jgi:glycosyltransferase involved in cell wall biosynthesis